jgi:hypothetical protein
VVPKNADQQCFRLLRVRTIGQRRSLASVDAIPFYIYYSMFGFQRVGDQIWAFADSRGKGFLLGGTAGRTTLSGEGFAASGRPLAAPRQHSPESCFVRSRVCL